MSDRIMCGRRLHLISGVEYVCYLNSGHAGLHIDLDDNVRWSDDGPGHVI